MGSSGEHVTERLRELRKAYPGVAVEQTTVPVQPATREQVQTVIEGGIVDASVRVERETGEVLCISEGDGWTVPHVQVPDGVEIETLVPREIRDRTGVEPALEELAAVTITGYRCDEAADGDERIYRLTAEFVGSPARGSPTTGAAWRALEEW